MAGQERLNDILAKEVEEQLFATLRKQSDRSVPIDLPRNDFWNKIGQLLDTIEIEIRSQFNSGGPDLRLQNLQKRQANIRRVANDLARRRLVSMLQHAVSISLRSVGNKSERLNAMDWSKHDPNEREFYTNILENIDRFKLNVDWQSMQRGLAKEGAESKFHAPGTTQLDDWVENQGGLTGQEPPPLKLIENEFIEDEFEESLDEEETIALVEGFPELQNLKDEIVEIKSVEIKNDMHKATPELAPTNTRTVSNFDAWANAEIAIEEKDDDDIQKEPLQRIRVITSMKEPIWVDEDEVEMITGDVHFLETNLAEYLINSGIAEDAPL